MGGGKTFLCIHFVIKLQHGVHMVFTARLSATMLLNSPRDGPVAVRKSRRRAIFLHLRHVDHDGSPDLDRMALSACELRRCVACDGSAIARQQLIRSFLQLRENTYPGRSR